MNNQSGLVLSRHSKTNKVFDSKSNYTGPLSHIISDWQVLSRDWDEEWREYFWEALWGLFLLNSFLNDLETIKICGWHVVIGKENTKYYESFSKLRSFIQTTDEGIRSEAVFMEWYL